MVILSSKDIKELEHKKYDATLKPSFNFMKSCLVWADEWPEKISKDGLEVLYDLWIGRYCICHSELAEEDWPLLPQYAEHIKVLWSKVCRLGIKWSGFHPNRLTLSPEDRDYLQQELKNSEEPY